MNKLKILLVIACALLIIPNVFCLSIIDAQNIARDYTLDNEFIDSRVFQVSCDDVDLTIISVVNSNNELIFFVPIDNDKQIYSQENNLDDLFKTSYLLKEITKQSSNNYLTITIIDAFDQLITILSSKRSQLQGIINADYSKNITDATKITKESVGELIDLLETLRESVNNARVTQQNFVDSPTCAQTNNVVSSLRDGFEGYNNLTLYGLNYQTSINNITEAIVSDSEVDENTKMIISGYISAPPNLSKDISNIQERLSSTNFFYSEIINNFLKIGENNSAIVAKNNFLSRQDYVQVVDLLYTYDSDLKNTLDNIVLGILDDNRYPYWKDKTTLSNLERNYQEIQNLLNRKRYSETIQKIKLLKSQAIKLEKEGFVDMSDVKQSYDYYVVVSVLILIVILFVVIKPKKKNKTKTKVLKKNKKDVLETFNKKDPFK